MTIFPKCKHRDDQVPALRVDGYVVPCCHMSGEPEFFELKKLIGDKIEQLHISKGTLDEINRSEAMYEIEQSFTSSEPMKVCTKICNKPFYETTKQGNVSTANYGASAYNLIKSSLDD